MANGLYSEVAASTVLQGPSVSDPDPEILTLEAGLQASLLISLMALLVSSKVCPSIMVSIWHPEVEEEFSNKLRSIFSSSFLRGPTFNARL